MANAQNIPLPQTNSTSSSFNAFTIDNTYSGGGAATPAAIVGNRTGGGGFGVIGSADTGVGVKGISTTSYGGHFYCGPPDTYDWSNQCIGLYAATGNQLPNATAVYASASQGTAVRALSYTGTAINALSTYGTAITATSTVGGTALNATSQGSSSGSKAISATSGGAVNASGVYATSQNGMAVNAYSQNGYAVYANSAATSYQPAIYSSGYIGVHGYGRVGAGVFGSTSVQNGVYGQSAASGASGVYGENYQPNGYGIAGRASAYGTAVLGDNPGGVAGTFNGSVHVYGPLFATTKYFEIDHPLDPANKVLRHVSVESPDAKTIYDGTVALRPDGSATVTLPTYFEALNEDFRYQLTCLGGYAAVYISREITNNKFEIAGGTSGLRVSWQVTGIRRDATAVANRRPVEDAKPADQVGKYLSPAVFGPSAQSVVTPPPRLAQVP